MKERGKPSVAEGSQSQKEKNFVKDNAMSVDEKVELTSDGSSRSNKVAP